MFSVKVVGRQGTTCFLNVSSLTTYGRKVCNCMDSGGKWWEDELNWAARKNKGKALISTILHISWISSIYFIWREKNQRLYQHITKTTLQIMKQVTEVVRYRVIGLHNIKAYHVNRSLCRNWNFPDTIFGLM